MFEPIVGPDKPVSCRLCKHSHVFLYCQNCNEPLRMGNNRIQYCWKCEESDSVIYPHSALCCGECGLFLRVTEDGGSYCAPCDFHPMAQDTLLWSLRDINNLT